MCKLGYRRALALQQARLLVIQALHAVLILMLCRPLAMAPPRGRAGRWPRPYGRARMRPEAGISWAPQGLSELPLATYGETLRRERGFCNVGLKPDVFSELSPETYET